jgi:cellobiose phosphorylase
MKENGSIFTHTQGWAVIAETMLGHGDRAWEYWRAYMPAAYNTRAEVREIEPYVYNQSTHENIVQDLGTPFALAKRLGYMVILCSYAVYSGYQARL